MSGSIPLSQKHGVNPSVCVCTNCGEDTGALVLPGRTNKYKCGCGRIAYGVKASDFGTCNCGRSSETWDRIETDAEMPHKIGMGICDKCEAMFEEHHAIVERGGIYWKCSDCGSTGVVRETSELSIHVRKQMNMPAPGQCGVEFSKKDCPACAGGDA